MERKRQREFEDGNEAVPPTSPIQENEDMTPFSEDSEENIQDAHAHVFEDDEDDVESEDLFGDNLEGYLF
jgi:hypothetical protein